MQVERSDPVPTLKLMLNWSQTEIAISAAGTKNSAAMSALGRLVANELVTPWYVPRSRA